jgi:peptide chain release factor 2
LQELELQTANPAIWNDHKKMQEINQEKTLLEREVSLWADLSKRIEDNQVILEMIVEEADEVSFSELKQDVAKLEKIADDLELKKMLNGEMDAKNVYLSINSGAGGTEACDWADMLFRMYTRYAEKNGYGVHILEMTEGEGAGIKSVTMLIEGPYAYGYLKAESGVHRLVRISPFDSSARRHTSFASVFALPEVDDDVEIEIRPEDLRVDTYRAGGAGGQHVNKTDSAVRLTHEPTGVVVQCQTERSQFANRDRAMKMLRAALYEKQVEERERQMSEINATKKANEWGSQIRSYVLHPYQMCKDLRTQWETSDVKGVLDGDLQDFVVAFLKQSSV